MKKLIAITLAIMVAFSFMPGLAESAHAAAKKPAKVKFAKCTSTKSSATLKWKKAKNAKKYEVYQLKAKKYKKIKTVKKTKFTVKKLKANTVYKFKVRAVNGKKKGKYSAIKRIKTKKVVKETETNTNTNTNPSTGTPQKPQGSITDIYFANNSTSVKVGESVTAKLLVEVRGDGKPVASNFTAKTNNGNVVASVTGIGGGVSESYYATVKITGKTAGSSVVTVSGYGFSSNIDVYINANTSSNENTSSGNGSNNNNNTNTSSDDTNTSSDDTNTSSVQQINFAKSTVAMTVDSSETLTLSNPSMAEATYTSSDTSVAEVECSSKSWAIVNAKSAGRATIIAKAGDKTATCVITVTDPNAGNTGGSNNSEDESGNGQSSEVALQSISFDRSSLELTNGDYETLYVSFSPSNTTADTSGVNYSVSNDDVLSIRTSGSTSVSIAAVGYGTATVTATLDGKTAKCTVTVSETSSELKYTYEFYKLEEATLFSNPDTNSWDGSNKLLVLTTNPDPDEVSFGLVGENSSVMPRCWDYERPSNYSNKYKDMNIPDQINGKYVYIVDYCFNVVEAKYNVYEEDVYAAETAVSDSSVTITTADYETAYNNWLNSYLNKYSYGTPRERLRNICNELQSEAKYHTGNRATYAYGGCNSLEVASTPLWVKTDGWYYYDCYFHPHEDFARILGASSVNATTHQWESVVFDDGLGEEKFSVCPDDDFYEPLENHRNTLTISDYECIAKFTK